MSSYSSTGGLFCPRSHFVSILSGIILRWQRYVQRVNLTSLDSVVLMTCGGWGTVIGEVTLENSQGGLASDLVDRSVGDGGVVSVH